MVVDQSAKTDLPSEAALEGAEAARLEGGAARIVFGIALAFSFFQIVTAAFSPISSIVLRSVPGELEGPGHCSVVTGPDGGDWIVYHAWDAQHTARRMCIDRIEWTAAGPRVLGPTVGPQPVPGTR